MILDDIASQLPGAKFYETYVLARCLFHSPDNNPSMFIYKDNYRCASCGAWGRSENLLDQLSSYSVIPKKVTAQTKNPWWSWLRKDTLFQRLKQSYQTIKQYPDQAVYLKNRGFTMETILNAKLGYSDGFYLIPVITEYGEVKSGFARAGESIKGGRYFVPSGSDPNLLYSPSWERVREAREVYLTYGAFDSLSLHQLGKAAISTTAGKRVSASAFSDIRKKIIIFPDFGEGKDARYLAKELGWRASVLDYDFPVGAKDANDLLKAGLLYGALA